MAMAKLAIQLDKKTLGRLDELIHLKVFPTRNEAIQEAVRDKLRHLDSASVEEESAKLDPEEEKAMAEEGMSEELKGWPEY